LHDSDSLVFVSFPLVTRHQPDSSGLFIALRSPQCIHSRYVTTNFNRQPALLPSHRPPTAQPSSWLNSPHHQKQQHRIASTSSPIQPSSIITLPPDRSALLDRGENSPNRLTNSKSIICEFSLHSKSWPFSIPACPGECVLLSRSVSQSPSRSPPPGWLVGGLSVVIARRQSWVRCGRLPRWCNYQRPSAAAGAHPFSFCLAQATAAARDRWTVRGCGDCAPRATTPPQGPACYGEVNEPVTAWAWAWVAVGGAEPKADSHAAYFATSYNLLTNSPFSQSLRFQLHHALHNLIAFESCQTYLTANHNTADLQISHNGSRGCRLPCQARRAG
jgi:hypothetical protein